MSEKLGICVATRDNISHVLGLTEAARTAGKETEIFLTAEGVDLTQDPRFSQLLKAADKVWVCEVSYNANGHKGKKVPELKDKNFSNQTRHATIVDKCDRYIVL